MKLRLAIQSLCVAVVVLGVSTAFAEPLTESGGNGTIASRAEWRREIRAMPILERPNRPGHFYGNTVRRIYYRNMAASQPREITNGTQTPISQ